MNIQIHNYILSWRIKVIKLIIRVRYSNHSHLCFDDNKRVWPTVLEVSSNASEVYHNLLSSGAYIVSYYGLKLSFIF